MFKGPPGASHLNARPYFNSYCTGSFCLFSRAYALWFTPIWLLCTVEMGGLPSFLPPPPSCQLPAPWRFSYPHGMTEASCTRLRSCHLESVAVVSRALQLSCGHIQASTITAAMPRSKKEKLRLKMLTEARLKIMKERGAAGGPGSSEQFHWARGRRSLLVKQNPWAMIWLCDDTPAMR